MLYYYYYYRYYYYYYYYRLNMTLIADPPCPLISKAAATASEVKPWPVRSKRWVMRGETSRRPDASRS